MARKLGALGIIFTMIFTLALTPVIGVEAVEYYFPTLYSFEFTGDTNVDVSEGAKSVTAKLVAFTKEEGADINKAEITIANLDNQRLFWSTTTSEFSTDTNGKSCIFSIEIPASYPAGEYFVRDINLNDTNNKIHTYTVWNFGGTHNNDYIETYMGDSDLGKKILDMRIKVQNNNSDTTPPVLKDVTVVGDKTFDLTGSKNPTIEVKIEEKLDIRSISLYFGYFKNYDDFSGGRFGRQGIAEFKLHFTGDDLTPTETDGDVKTYTITPDMARPEYSHYRSGNYYLSYISIEDASWNAVNYGQNEDKPIDANIIDTAFLTLNNDDNQDTTPPEIREIRVLKEEVNRPGSVPVKINVTENIKASSEWKKDYFMYIRFKGGIEIYHGGKSDEDATTEANVWQFTPVGKHYIEELFVSDYAGNHLSYGGVYKNPIPDEFKDIFITVKDKAITNDYVIYNPNRPVVRPDGTTKPDTSTKPEVNQGTLPETITDAAGGATISVDYTGDPVASAETFEALAGTDKRIIFKSDSVEWEFNGKNIDKDQIKDIDLSVKLDYAKNLTGERGKEIQKFTRETNSLVISLPENGALPGVAKIRIKADAAMRNLFGTEGVFAYYFDNKAGTFKQVNTEGLKITTDNYFEFEIDHCSEYILTAGKMEDSSKIYRMYNPINGDHVYVNKNEHDRIMASNLGWIDENPYFEDMGAGEAIYRYYNEKTGEHIFTKNEKEKKHLGSIGWKNEGVVFYSKGKKDVYRMYNGVRHMYTTSELERDMLKGLGWVYEGIAFTVS